MVKWLEEQLALGLGSWLFLLRIDLDSKHKMKKVLDFLISIKL